MVRLLKQYFLTVLLLFCTCWLQAQKKQTFRDTIQNISQLWDKAFNMRDTTAYFNLVDTTFSIAAGGGTSTGLTRFKFVTNRLHANRPDIVMSFRIKKADISDSKDIGYDT